MASMTRGGGVAAPDPALQAKRAILYLQALQRVRSQPDGTASAATLRRLHAGPGGLGMGGIHVQQARALDDSSVTALMAGLAALRKKIGTSAAPIYSQPF